MSIETSLINKANTNYDVSADSSALKVKFKKKKYKTAWSVYIYNNRKSYLNALYCLAKGNTPMSPTIGA